MKINAAKKVHYESGPNMTPLVDVVMVILIFLMLAGSFGTTEKYMVTTLPSLQGTGGGTGEDDGLTKVKPQKVELKVNVEGGVTLPHLVGQPAITDMANVLKPELEKKLKEYTDSGRAVDEVMIVIEPQGDTAWERLAPVYDAALRAGYKSVSFNTVE